MLFLLFLLVGGGAAAAVASSGGEASTSSTGDGFRYLVAPSLLPTRTIAAPSDLAATMKRAGYVWREGVEKFRDPQLSAECRGVAGAGPYTIREGLLPGEALVYLNDAPPTAVTRIALLRARVEAEWQPSDFTKKMAYWSQLRLQDAADSLLAKVRDPAAWAAIAEHIGVPVTKITEAEAALETAINKLSRTYLRFDVMSLFQDLRSTLGGALADALAAQVSQIGKYLAGAQAVKDAASFVGDVSAAASSIMPFVKVIVDKAIELDAAKRAAWAAECQDFMDGQIVEPIRQTLDQKLPPAWHAIDVWHVTDETWCPKPGFLSGKRWTPSGDQEGAAADARGALVQMRELTATPRLFVKRWWALACLLAADDLVQHTLANLGRVRGLWASDEQVALVGIPIAVSYGLEPWKFCELLYGYAKGWAGWEGDVVRRGGCRGVEVVTNAWALQFADLARCGFALAEALKGSTSSAPAGFTVAKAVAP